jgi:hypothetical protein
VVVKRGSNNDRQVEEMKSTAYKDVKRRVTMR